MSVEPQDELTYEHYGIKAPKDKLVFDYMVEFWKDVPKDKRVKKYTLAHIIKDELPEIFKDAEEVRDIIRKLTKNQGNKNSKRPDIEFTPDNPMGITHSFSYNQATILEIPEKYDKVLIISDLQVPFHDVPALTLALNYGIEHGMNCLYINGDLADWMAISRFEDNPLKRRMKVEYYTVLQVLEDIRRIVGPDVKIYYKLGNHDIRWERYLWKHSYDICNLPFTSYQEALNLDKLDIELVGDTTEARFGKLSVYHGHELKVYSSVNPARGFYVKYEGNILGGHHHRTASHISKTGRGQYQGAWSTGCLCQMRPEFAVVNKWNHGFAFVEWTKKNFDVHNMMIIDGKVMNG